MGSERSDRAISMHCPLCGYATATVTLPIVTLDRITLRSALAQARPADAPQWNAALEPQCPRGRHSRLLLDIAPLDAARNVTSMRARSPRAGRASGAT